MISTRLARKPSTTTLTTKSKSMNNKPNYLTRVSKHIERKIFIETLQCLNKYGFDTSTYHYVGFGSYHYVDFILFNKFLSIQKMTCLEKEQSLTRRMKFNKPFKFIDLQMEDFASYVSGMRNDRKYLVWIDYEDELTSDILRNIASLVNTLQNGSVFIITVRADLKEIQETYATKFLNPEEKASLQELRKKTIEGMRVGYENELSPYCGSIQKSDITPGKFPDLFAKTISSIVNDSLIGRPGDKFFQLFNYVYKDGVTMLTFGGIVDKEVREKDITKALKNIPYINGSLEPIKIKVPILTLREKLYIDQKAPNNKKTPHGIPFEIDDQELLDYIKYSKHYPNFYEVYVG